MPNKQYQAGRREEYACQQRWELAGYATTRASGSHSHFDVIAYRTDSPVEMIQCKRVSANTTAQILIKKFKQDPPFLPSRFFHQRLEVKIKGTTNIISIAI